MKSADITGYQTINIHIASIYISLLVYQKQHVRGGIIMDEYVPLMIFKGMVSC